MSLTVCHYYHYCHYVINGNVMAAESRYRYWSSIVIFMVLSQCYLSAH